MMKSHGTRITLVVIVLSLLAFALYTSNLEAGSLSVEESRNLYRSRLGVPQILLSDPALPDGHSVGGVRPPLYFLSLAVFKCMAGESDFALRFFSAAWAMLLVPLLYVAGVRFWNRSVGVMAALFGALSPWYFQHAREAQMYTMVLALSLGAVYALDRALEKRRPARLIAAILAVTAAVCTHYLALLLVPALALRSLLEVRFRLGRYLAILWALGGAVLAGVAGYALWRLVPGLKPESGAAALLPSPAGLLAFRFASIPGERILWLIGAALLALALSASFWPAPGRRWPALVAYVALPLVVLYGILLLRPAGTADGYVLLASPALYLGLAAGLEWTGRRFWPAALLIFLVVLAGIGLSTGSNLLAPTGPATPDYRAAAQAIQANERSGDVIVISPPEYAVAFLHYYKGRLPAMALPSGDAASEPAACEQALATAAKRFGRIWLVKYPPSQDGSPGLVGAWLAKNTFLAQSIGYPGGGAALELQLYLASNPLLPDVPSHQHTARVDFGNLRLEGYDLPLRSLAGGEHVWVTLYWRTLSAGPNVKVALRLIDEQGREWSQSAGLPYPAFPPERWPAGSVVRQETCIVVPTGAPPGWYRLELRLYDPQNGHPVEPSRGAEPGPLGLGPLRVDGTWAERGAFNRLVEDSHILHGRGIAFGEGLALRAYRFGAQQVRPGEWLHLDLYWEVDQPANRDLSLVLELVDAAGKTIYSRSASPVAATYPPALWKPGELLRAQHEILIPPTTQPGPYRLRLSLLDGGSHYLPIRNQWQFWTWGQEATFLDSVQVIQVPSIFNRPPMDRTLDAQSTAGIDLLGFSGVKEAIARGQDLDLTLYWRAAVVPNKSYKVSVQLLAADQRTILVQEDSIPGQWTRSTTSWSLGEIVSDSHHLSVPASAGPQMATLIVALYDEDSGRRAEWLGGGQIQEYVVLCPVEIVR